MSKKKQIKTPAIPVPATRAQAEHLLAEIGACQRMVDKVTARVNERVTELQLAAAEEIGPYNEKIKARFTALHAWAEAHRSELLDGDAKTVKLSSGTIAWRFTPPSVQITRNKTEHVLAELLEDDRLQEEFVRISYDINKQAILDCLTGDDTELKGLLEGVEFLSAKRTEEFTAKPLDMDHEYVGTVKPAKAAK